MYRLIYKKFIIIVFIASIGCKSTSNSNHRKQLPYLHDKEDYLSDDYLEKLKEYSNNINKDSVRANTSDFYDIQICSKPNKIVFNLKDEKLFSLQITNYGTKEFYLPEWFRVNRGFSNSEMTIEIYRKEKQKFEKYIQKKMKTDIFVQPAINSSKRVVFESNKGKHISYENILVDKYLKIVDEGSYKAKIYIDLSNFGYFKILETEFLFEVKN